MVPLMSMLRAGAQARRARLRPRPRRRPLLRRARPPRRRRSSPTPAGRRAAGRATRAASTAAMLREVDVPGARVYVCGPTPFVESVADDLVRARPRPGDDPNGALRMSHLDGNAAARLTIFARDLTMAVATCAGCGATGPVATVMVYEGMGSVLRCPSCDSVLMRVVVRAAARRAWRCAASGPCAGEAPVDHAQRVAAQDPLRRLAGDGRAARPRTASGPPRSRRRRSSA